jgi:AGZA family xanthine/uracil permease-like MFS transporter
VVQAAEPAVDGRPRGARGLRQLPRHRRARRVSPRVAARTRASQVYIVHANPYYQTGRAFGFDTGQPAGPLATATAVATGASTLVMGVVANAPLVVAPAMATNGYFALKTSGWMTWRSQLSLSLLSSLGYVALVAFLAKRGSLARLIRALPVSYLVGVGFGLLMFLAHLGLLDESGAGRRPASATMFRETLTEKTMKHRDRSMW